MKLRTLWISNFKSWRDSGLLSLENMHAIVGSNNAGKSSLLKALDFLFNPSVKNLDEECFWNCDTNHEIKIEAIFEELTDSEKVALASCLRPDGRFHMARTAKCQKGNPEHSDSTDSEEKITISQRYCKPQPRVPWLREGDINGDNIKQWWTQKHDLVVEGISFADFLGTTKQPGVGEWKKKAQEFIIAYASKIQTEDIWEENPKGYANVLKSALPFFVLIPAVRDVVEESKVTKSNPFGRLLYAILDTVADKKRQQIESLLKNIAKQFNRIGGSDRVELITKTEDRLNALLGDLFKNCDLEIEFQTPTLEVMFSSPRIYVDDGCRNLVENKGHGLQRAVILSILRHYAEHMTSHPTNKRTLILAIEEPELYMHPHAQRTVRKVFRKMADNGDQVLFSTHSSLLVDVAYFDEIIRVESSISEINKKKAVLSKARQLTMKSMIDDLVKRNSALAGKVTPLSMRDAYSNAYNPTRNEGFFAKKIILVEGATEEYSLPVFADTIKNSFDSLNVSVVECGGKGPMDRLYRIFNELGIPCYILIDYDKNNKAKEMIQKSDELIALCGEKYHGLDSPYAGNMLAYFPETWEKQMEIEIPSYHSLCSEARKVLGLKEDSKPLMARYVARKLTETTHPVVPPTIRAIIERAIGIEWQKSCLTI